MSGSSSTPHLGYFLMVAKSTLNKHLSEVETIDNYPTSREFQKIRNLIDFFIYSVFREFSQGFGLQIIILKSFPLE